MKTGTSLTDAEIIKAFDCCYTDRYPDCTECPRYNREKEGCMDVGNGNIYDLPKAMIDLAIRQQKTINRLKAENKNCGVKIQNQREQLKACNEKIKEQQAEIESLEAENKLLINRNCELAEKGEKAIIHFMRSQEEIRAEAIKEFAERSDKVAASLQDYLDTIALNRIYIPDFVAEKMLKIVKEMGCGE